MLTKGNRTMFCQMSRKGSKGCHDFNESYGSCVHTFLLAHVHTLIVVTNILQKIITDTDLELDYHFQTDFQASGDHTTAGPFDKALLGLPRLTLETRTSSVRSVGCMEVDLENC